MSPSRIPPMRRGRHLVAAATAISLAGFGLMSAPAFAVTTDGEIFISEIHYDNAGTDTGEAIEIQAPVGTDLSGWSLVLYNAGSNGANADAATAYSNDALSGVVGESGVAVATYPRDGIQNGPNDGIALVDPDGTVVELLSYEGVLTAADGPAAGLVSTDIGVSQPSDTPIGQSLQRIDGVWTGPAESSFGTLNSGTEDPDPDPDPEPGERVSIADIQGTGDASPLIGETVTTTGVVTAVYATGGFNGYYIQTAGSGGDTDPSARTASDGVFVYSPSTVGEVEIGQHLELTGVVDDYAGLTELLVSAGGVTVLTEPFEPVVPIADFVIPADDAGREVFEGMLVLPADRYVISDTYNLGGWGTNAFGTIGLGLDGPLVQETEIALPGTPEFDAAAADNAARSITLDDGNSARTSTDADVPYLTGNPDIRTGALLDFVSPVIVDYRFQWNFQPTSPVTGNADDVVVVGGGNTQAANDSPQEVGGDVTLATFNVLNYFTTLGVDLPGCVAYTDRDGNPISVSGGCDARGAWDVTNFERQQAKIVTAINGLDADVVSLEEIENSAKFGQDRDTTLAALVEALNADAGAGTWAYAPSPSVLPDLAEQDVIRNAFIYKPASVELAGESVVLVGSAAFSNAREPLAQAFTVVGSDYTFLAVTNHFKSKGGDCGDLPEGCFDGDRVAQAQALTTFAQDVADAAGIADIFLLGDFNSYGAEKPAVAIEAAGYTNVNTEESTYVYDGKVGSLDHVFANESAASRVSGVDVWNINSVESVLAEYSRYNYFASQHFQPGTQYRASDHDPIIVGLDAGDPTVGPTTIDLLSINDFHGRIEADRESAGAAVLACTVDSYRDANPNTLFVSVGDNIGASTFVSAVAQDQPTLDVLNAMELDVSTFGNHEFDKGQDDVNDRVIPASAFPYVAANIYGADGERVYDPYALVETSGVTVGFIGAITEDMPSLVSPRGIVDLEWRDMTTEVNAVAQELSDGDETNGEADVIVVLVHDGAPSSTVVTDDSDFGDLVGSIDSSVSAILSGHTHQAYATQVGDVWVMQSAKYGEEMGHLQLTFDPATGEVAVGTAENLDLVAADGTPACEGDSQIQGIVDDAVEAADELGSVTVGTITDDLLRAGNADGTENRSAESTLGNLIADAQLWATQDIDAQIAMTNAGGIRTDLLYASSAKGEGDGVVTYAEAATVQPFANTLVLTELTGEQIERVLEGQWQAVSGGEELSKLSISSGLHYFFDPNAPIGERVVGATLDGEPLVADQTYRVVTNSYMAAGGDGYEVFLEGAQNDTGRVDLDAFVEYLQAQEEPVAPDLVQRSVGITWISDPTAELAVGDEIAFDLSSLAFTRAEDKPSEVTVTLGGVQIVTAAVDTTVLSGTDSTGRAEIRAEVPAGLAGEVELVASDDVSGVVYSTTVMVQDAVVDTTRPETTLVAPTSAGPFQVLNLQVDATDDVGLNRIVANIYSGGTLVRSTQTSVDGATSGTHTATVTLPEGTYTIRYNASDLAGNISATRTVEVTIDTTAPTVTVKTGSEFTVGGPDSYTMVSYKLFDAGKIDRFTLNGVDRDLSNNTWSDINFIEPGQFGAVAGENTLVVYDVAGNATTLTFTLDDPAAPAPDPWQPWKDFAQWLWGLLQMLFPWWPWP